MTAFAIVLCAQPSTFNLKSPRCNPMSIYDNATHATFEKGRVINEHMIRIILDVIEDLRGSALHFARVPA